jgi:type I restriction enzyme, S subunit
MSLDLLPLHLRWVEKILAEHVPEYEVLAFGSRVTGRAKRFSDLDLAIISDKPLAPRRLALLADALSESDLPIKVDLLDWAASDPGMRQRIESEHEVLQRPRPPRPL